MSVRWTAVRVGRHVARAIELGEGDRTIVILASLLVRAEVYLPTMRALAGRARVVAVDLPGCGAASRVARPLSMAELADLVPPLLDGLRVAKAVLVGHSNSGAVVVHAAVRHPDRVARIVLADSIGAHRSASLVPVIAGRAVDALLEWRLTLTGWPAIVSNMVCHPGTFWTQVGRCAGEGLLAVAREVRVPATIAWGARDHTMPLEAGERLRDAIPGAGLVVSRTGSHDWLIVEPHGFARAIG